MRGIGLYLIVLCFTFKSLLQIALKSLEQFPDPLPDSIIATSRMHQAVELIEYLAGRCPGHNRHAMLEEKSSNSQ